MSDDTRRIPTEAELKRLEKWFRVLSGVAKKPKSTCGHTPEITVNLRKDFRSLHEGTELDYMIDSRPQTLACCMQCVVDYMNAFNVMLEVSKEMKAA